ncbi:patatin-like phospholipase family protein [Acrocarpospora sp. B8E8]|uniref:patatin-like phospholipase family protein n=1 Tax=Acrocarpospora sp. B8E8 TaxID=3153572 RepID=UPI00325E28B1
MKAFVLWGAGSLGAAQVGVRADLVVGASIGALNAAHYATHPSPAGVEELAGLWLSVGRHDVYPSAWARWHRSQLVTAPLSSNITNSPEKG